MHCLIQCPRLIVSIRNAIRNPNDALAIATAVILAETLWDLSQQDSFTTFVDTCAFDIDVTVDEAVADVVPCGIRFDTAQNMVICTRYWLLRILLCGCIDTLHRKFPQESAHSNLPNPAMTHQVDTDAGVQLGKVALSLHNDPLPLMLLRTHGPLSISMGSWHRQLRYLHSSCHDSSERQIQRLSAATRMQSWVLQKCNVVMKRLNVSQPDESAWMETLDCMTGEELADWMPSKVSFGSEDGDMVMKLEYSDRAANSDSRGPGNVGATRVFNIRNPARFGPHDLREWIKGSSGLKRG